MNIQELRQLLQDPYSTENWRDLLVDVFENVQFLNPPTVIPTDDDRVRELRQYGTIQLSDGKNLALFEMSVNEDKVRLLHNRVGLNELVRRYIDQDSYHGILSVFDEGSEDYRFTFTARNTDFDEEEGFIDRATDPKRLTYILGKNQSCRTPAERFLALKNTENQSINAVEEAFNVEKLSKKFFNEYISQFDKLVNYIKSKPNYYQAIFENKETPARNFVKQFMGRLVFLKFVQKKGWLGVPVNEEGWDNGDYNFLENQYRNFEHKGIFVSIFLNPLFFEALNTGERENDEFQNRCYKIPYLSGGLFENDYPEANRIDFPEEYLTELFQFFERYNFTIDENDVNDKEVGIDPEMLGHIFENLLEDNKDKGAYYTPKTIVSYMCRQSLLRYLETHLGKNEHLTRFCELHDPGDLREKGNWCAAHAKEIAELLERVKICDPAIGSGAFPIGMLNEIVNLRTLLNAELNDPAERAKLKKAVIQNSIYGVDLDSGAVDIARLRFWLALIVDEETPSPLPNLDYKIMQGNSLLESFQGVDLSSLHEEDPESETPYETAFGLNQMELGVWTEAQQEFRTAQKKKQRDLLNAMQAYFVAGSPGEKAELRGIIDQRILAHIRHYFEMSIDETDAEHHRTETDWSDKRRLVSGWNPPAAEIRRQKKRTERIEFLKKSLADLEALKDQAERPFFLWRLLFQDVFANGGFDIVIANPPYVRQELIREQKPLLQAEGYSTYTGTADLFVYFYERAIQLLKPNGVLTFITSNKFYRAGYGEKLRAHLTENLTLYTLIDFRD